MPNLTATIGITDNLTSPLRNMANAINSVTQNLGDIASEAGKLDTKKFSAMQSAAQQLDRSVSELEAESERAANAQNKHNKAMQQGDKDSGKLSSGFKSLAGAVAGVVAGYASWQTISAAVDLSDTLSQTTSRLNMMNDGMQTTEELQQKIYEAAQNSRGSYQDMADMVSKLGTNAAEAFSSNDEMVRFAEQLNKQFVLAGASADEMAAASLQLTQGLASGTLRGDELNSVMEQAPTVIQTIADSLGVTTGQIRDMAAEGQITADVVKNALLNASDETNAKFEQMSLTFDQVWTNFKNQALMSFQPVLESINEIANNPQLTEGINRVSGVIGGLGPSIASVVSSLSDIIPVGLNAVIDSFEWVIDNGSMVVSGLLGIASAVTAVNVANKVKDAGGFAEMFSGLGNSMSAIIGLINPLNLLIAAIAGVAAAAVYLVATGTSLKEVSDFFTNFQNSVANAVESITSGIGDIAQGIADTFPTFAAQLGAMIPTIVSGILGSAMSLIDAGAQIAVALLNGLMTALPSLVTGGISMITNLITGLTSMLPQLIEQAAIIIENFMSALSQNLPNMLQKGAEAVLAFVNGIGQSLPVIMQAGLSMIVGFVQTVAEHVPTLIQRGVELVSSLVQGIVSMLPELAATAVSLIVNLGAFIISNLPQIITAGIQIIVALASGIIQSIPVILSGIGQILVSLITAIGEYGPQILTKASEIAGQLWEGLKSGLSAGWEAFTGFLSDTFNGVVDFVKGIFGVASPSTVFADIGGFLMEGLGNGIQSMWDGISGGISAIGGAIKDLLTPDVDYAEMINNTRTQINQLQSDVQAGYETIKNVTLTQGQEMANGTIAVYAAMSSQILSQVGTMASQINGLLGQIAQSFTAIFEAIRQQAVSYLGALSVDAVAQITAMIGQVATNLAGLTPVFSSIFSGITGSVINELANLESGAVTVLQVLAQSAIAVLESIRSSAINTVTQMSGDFIGQITIMAQGVGTIISGMAEVVKTAIIGLHLAIVTEAEGFYNSYTSIWSDVRRSVTNTVSLLAADLKNQMSKLVNDLIAEGNRLPSEFNKIGHDMISELASGISSQEQQVTSVTSALVEKMKNIFITGLGIHSPSKFMEWIGQMMAAGLMGGLNSSQIQKFVEGIIGNMKNSFKNGNFVPEELVEYLGEDTTKVIEYLTRTGDQTLSEAAGAVGVPAIIQEALKYVGYVSPGGHGGSMFGARYGNGGAWCGSFVKYCADNVGVPIGADNPHYVPSWLAWARATGRETQTPQPGYAAIFGGGSHIELVANVLPDGTVDMVGGNTGIGEVKHRPRADATSYVMLDGGHSTLTLKDTIQQAYFKKMGIFGTGGNLSPDQLASAMAVDGSGLLNPPWFQQWQPSAQVAQWADEVSAVLNMLGEPQSLLKGVLWAINGESGGDPNSTYLQDVNVIYGGSKGLLQTITPNFEKWKNPNLANDIYDPMQNIWCCLREMQDTYGGIANLINRKIARGRWSGYATGVESATRGLHWVGEQGPELLQFDGGERIYPHRESVQLAQLNYGASEGSYVDTGAYVPVYGGTTNNQTNNTPIHFQMEPTINTHEEFRMSLSEVEHLMAQALRNVAANNAAGLH